MATFDTIIKGGTVVTASDSVSCDVAIRDGVIAALGHNLGDADRIIDASGLLVLPGGVEGHCHICQDSADGLFKAADDFFTATRSAVFGGTTSVLSFANQEKGESPIDVVKKFHGLAGPNALIDYGFHLIITDPTEQVLHKELPVLIEQGMTSFKVFMAYDDMELDDGQMLEILSVARTHKALVMIHAENNNMIKWLSKKLIEKGHSEAKYHSIAHPGVGDAEATYRAIKLSELLDVPILIVHVSAEEAMENIRTAQDSGVKIYGETCPQYLFLTADDLDRNGAEGAKYCCSPPPRDAEGQEAIWRGIENGTFQIFSSDHAPTRFDDTGKLAHGTNPPFTKIANGVPGIELRLPLLFSEGVNKGRIDIQKFVALTSTNTAKIYGMHPKKGTIAVGADADIALWDPELERTVTWDDLHDNVGYTPYEGKTLKGWPVMVLSRGRVAVENGQLMIEQGSGEFLVRDKPESAEPAGRLVSEMDPARNFGAHILPGS